MITSVKPFARYTSLIGATGFSEVRSIFGSPMRLKHCAFSNIIKLHSQKGFQTASKNFGIKRLF